MVYIRFLRVDTSKRQTNKKWSMTKKWKFIHKKRSFENLVREKMFPSPQTRRQVSAYAYMA